MKRNFLFIFIIGLLSLVACKEEDSYQKRMEDERHERSAYLERNGMSKANLLDEGVYYQVLKESTKTNAKKVEIGDDVVIYYTGYFLDGKVFKNNELAGKFEPRTIRIQSIYSGQIIREGVASGSVTKGWIPALLQMKEGMRAKVVIPSNMAYGFYGTSNPDVTFIPIPSYTSLVFEIEVKEVRKIE